MAEFLLDAEALERSYSTRGRAGPAVVNAVDRVSLRLRYGSSYGLVGESGSGKSTLCRLLLALERPDAGTVHFDGTLISHLPPHRVRPLRRRFQAVFQDPIGSLNPRLRIATLIAEPLVAHKIGSTAERRERVRYLLHRVGLPAESATRFPGAFSGGERQRIAIARALAPDPDLLILDEPVSSLDASVQSGILELLRELRDRFRLTIVLVSHALDVVARLTDRVGVMYRGAVLEDGPVETVMSGAAHPYTRDLLDATPRPETDWQPPTASDLNERHWPHGSCRYASRCPLATELCDEEPRLEAVSEGHIVACWHADRVISTSR